MSNIPYVRRVDARYVWRRRVHFRNLISKPLPVALRTACPKVARRRAAMLAARFAVVKLIVEAMLENQTFLTGAQIEALFRRELEQELERNLGDALADAPWSTSVAEAAVPLAEAYRIARRPERPRGLTDADRSELEARGIDAGDIHQVAEYLAQFCHEMSDAEVGAKLAAIGAPATADIIGMARGHVLRARADAWRRTMHVFDEGVMAAPNPIQALLDLPVASGPLGSAPALPPAPSQAPPAETSFLIYDKRRFSKVIVDIVDQLRREGTWSRTNDQPRRILGTFAWITGDKELGAYTHLDVDAFKQGLMRLPKDFRFGSSTDGAMARPFADVVAELPPVARGDERHVKTVNRDLSTMSRVSRHLAQTVWKPRLPNTLVLDFAAATITVKKKQGEDPRPPWTKEHLALLFGSPIYTGGGGALRRLHPHGAGRLYQDAAYWVPLICYYHHTCREETCGLRVDEIVSDHNVPYLRIKDNDVRGRDGELAGEKRPARRRDLPLHAELIRLGFLDYVRAIQAEGHVELFPELYLQAGKRGGQQFYAIAWKHMVAWIEARLALPRNKSGKGPDMHSIRALGSSFYEVDGVNEIMRADVMGHARTSVNGKHYSKRQATEGLDVILAERRDFMARYVPNITGGIVPRPIALLQLCERSRVGAGVVRKVRSDAGTGLNAPRTRQAG